LNLLYVTVEKKTYLLTQLLTCLLTPCSRVLLEKLTGSQLDKKVPGFYGTWRFNTGFTSDHHLSLSWVSSIQSIPPHPTSWRSILILSSYLCLGLPSGRLFPSSFPTKTLYTPLISPFTLHIYDLQTFKGSVVRHVGKPLVQKSWMLLCCCHKSSLRCHWKILYCTGSTHFLACHISHGLYSIAVACCIFIHSYSCLLAFYYELRTMFYLYFKKPTFCTIIHFKTFTY
jgi:hypothetical protein